MAQAIESAERYDQFVADAVASLTPVQRTGLVFKGAEFAAYLRAKASGDAQAVKPQPRLLADFVAPGVSVEKA